MLKITYVLELRLQVRALCEGDEGDVGVMKKEEEGAGIRAVHEGGW